MHPRLAPVAGLMLVGALVAGCGSDSSEKSESSKDPSPSASSEPSASPATPTVTVTVTETAAPAEPTSPSGGPQDCAPQGDIKIRILLGQVDCVSAYLVAARVDRGGEKRQDISGYVCEFGTAMTRPTIFTCTNPDLGAEFAADER